MKKNISKIFIVAIWTVAFFLPGCVDRFEKINKNPYGATNDDIKADLLPASLRVAQLAIYIYSPPWDTQLQQNLMGDVYSGYMMSPSPFRGNSNNMTYDLVDGWNTFAFVPTYDNVMNPISTVEEYAGKDHDKQDLYAMAKIIKVEAMHRTSDIFGPIIYSKYKKEEADGSVPYDSQEEVYNHFFEDLKTAIDILTPMASSKSSAQFTSSDLAYGGSYSKWLKFANSLRLRLAIRISRVNAAKAKAEGEAALANAGGLISTNSESFFVDFGATNHPLNIMNNDWSDIRMGAPMESIMGGYNDPRLPKYFVAAIDPAVVGQFKGIRNGISIDAKSRYQDYSKLITLANKAQLMTVAEVWFLKAEASLRGWVGAGVAQTNYEKGIEVSFDQYGLSASAAAYKNDATAKPKEYRDIKSLTPGQNDVLNGNPNLSTITIKWDEAASAEQKLERIITQKWIAVYPDGQEAWSEFRRTGYPKLFPVVINNSGGKITGFVKRINFVYNEYATNKSAVDKAVKMLGGPDTGGTPLWWDID